MKLVVAVLFFVILSVTYCEVAKISSTLLDQLTGKKLKQLDSHESCVESSDSNMSVEELPLDSQKIRKISREPAQTSQENMSRATKEEHIPGTKGEPIVIPEDDETLTTTTIDTSVPKKENNTEIIIMSTSSNTDPNEIQSTPNVMNKTKEPADYIVLLYKPNDREKVLGIGASIVFKHIRLDLNILLSCHNPDIVFLHDQEERKCYMSLDCGTFGQIQYKNPRAGRKEKFTYVYTGDLRDVEALSIGWRENKGIRTQKVKVVGNYQNYIMTASLRHGASASEQKGDLLFIGIKFVGILLDLKDQKGITTYINAADIVLSSGEILYAVPDLPDFDSQKRPRSVRRKRKDLTVLRKHTTLEKNH